MRVGILTHDNGPIPPDKWAAETAAQLVDVIQIEPNSLAFEALTKEKKDFEADLVASLMPIHASVQSNEDAALIEHGDDRLDHPLEPDAQLDEAVQTVRDLAHKRIFGNHFDKPEVIEFVRHTIGSHFMTVQNIHRSWHADKHPGTEQAKRFRERQNG